MKLDFKRILSFVLALVMTVSALTVVNVSSVMAADGDRVFDLGSTTVRSKLTFNDSNQVQKNSTNSGYKSIYDGFGGNISDFSLYLKDNRDAKEDAIDADNDTNITNYAKQGYIVMKGGSNPDYISFATSSDSSTLTLYVSKVDSGNRGVKVTSETTGSVEVKEGTPADGNIPTKNAITKFEYTLKGQDTYKIQANSGNPAYFHCVIVNEGTGDAPTPAATWSVKTDANLQGKVELEQLTNSTSAVLRYTDADNKYSVIPSRRIILPGGEYVTDVGNNHTLDLTGSKWDYYLTENLFVPLANISISGEDAKNRVLHLECDTHKTVYSIKLSDADPATAIGMLVEGENGGYEVDTDMSAGIPLHSGDLIATMAGGTLDGEDTQTVSLSSSGANTINFAYAPYEVNPISDSTGKIELKDLKITSIARAERLLGGTVLDKTTKHFFVAANKDAVSNSIFALTDPVELGTDIDMKALVIRRPDSADSPKEGVGFTLASAGEEENVSYTLKVYCTAVADVQSGDGETSIGIQEIDPGDFSTKGDAALSQNVPIQDAGVIETPEQPIEFGNLQPGKSYAVYNPYGANQGNLRIFAMELVKVTDTSSPGDAWYAVNQNQILGNSYYNAATSNGLSRDGEFSEAIFGDDVKSIRGQKYVAISAPIVPNASGKLLLYLVINNNDSKSANVKEAGTQHAAVTLPGREDKNILPIEFTVEKGKSYTIETSSSDAICLYKAELKPDEPAKATITGSVKETGKLEAKIHSNSDQLASKSDQTASDYSDHKNTATSGSVAEKAIADAVVTITGDDLEGEQTAEVKPDGSFSFDNNGDLKDGTYTVKATTKNGKLIGTETIEVTGGVADKTANFTLDNTVAVTLTTDIKDYKTAIELKSGSNTITISDVTYHYLQDSGNGDVARSESVTHYFNAPAGTYSVAFSKEESRFAIQDRSGKKLDSITIGENGAKSQTVRLYIAPSGSVEATDAKAKAATLKPVERGIYRFIRQKTEQDATTKSSAAAIKFKSTESSGGSFTDDTEHMYAEGIYREFKSTDFTDGYEKGPNDGRIGISDGVGYVVFKVAKGDSYIAKIKTSTATCILERVEGDGMINNNRSIVSVDSRFDTTAISITGGTLEGGSTYVLACNAPASDEDKGAANVESIEFDVASPFEVVNNVVDFNEDGVQGKLVVGMFNMEGLDEDALNNYSTFAILVAESQDALKWAAINGTEYEGHTPSDDKEIQASTGDEQDVSGTSEKHVTNGHVMKVPINADGTTVNVLRDETQEVFKKIIGEGEKPLVPEDGNYYYGVVVQKITQPLYAIGAAKSTDTGKWTVQGTPVTITAN